MENTSEKPIKLRPITQEERDAITAKRIEDQEWAKKHLKTEWMDENWMRDNAASIGLKLAGWWMSSSVTKYIRRALKHVGKDGVWHKEVFGYSIGEWKDYNPSVPAWVAQCQIVEQYLLEKTK